MKKRGENGQFVVTHGHGIDADKPTQPTPTYICWASMKARCLNPSDRRFPDYGGRGITVCDRWLEFENFLADMGEKPSSLTIERIDNNGSYSPGNCKWATQTEQMNNRRCNRLIEFDGRTMTLTQWAREFGVSRHVLWSRLRKQPFEKAMTPGLQPKGGDWKKRRAANAVTG